METIFSSSVDAPESDRKDLLSELELMKGLKPHPHVIKLMGCVTESGKLTMNFFLMKHFINTPKTHVHYTYMHC